MLNHGLRNLFVALTTMSFVSTSIAIEPSAMLKQVEGRVLVIQDDSSEVGRNDLSLLDGNRVIGLNDGAATVIYRDGCVITLKRNYMHVIKTAGQCSARQALVNNIEGFNGQPVGLPAVPAGAIGGGVIGAGIIIGLGGAAIWGLSELINIPPRDPISY